MIQENYRAIDARVAAACEKAGRRREDVTLVAVSKTKPEELIRELMEIGVRDFGEIKCRICAARWRISLGITVGI